MKRSHLKQKTPLKVKRPMRRKSTRKRVKRKIPSKGYQPPQWFKDLEYRSYDHGSNAIQKRLWRLVSQTYREQDFNLFGNQCPGCGGFFETWEAGQCGHWLKYSLCNSFFKFERVNLAMICAGCNRKDDAVTLKKIGEALQMRYGSDVLDYIEQENQRWRGVKMESWMIVDYAAKIRPDLVAIVEE